MFRQAGSSRSTPSRRCSTSPSCWPTNRCPRRPRGHRRQLRRAGPARGRRGGRQRADGHQRHRLGSEATAEDFEDALDAAIDDDHVDAVVAVYIPPLDAGGEEVANVLAAVGEQSDKPLVSTFLGREGVPELLRVPDLSGHTAGRGSVPSYPAVEAAVRALARVTEYAAWLKRHDDAPGVLEGIDVDAATRLVNEVLMHTPEGRELDDAELQQLLGLYGIDLWERIHASTVEEAVAARERLGWDVVLKATAERLRQRPTWPTCGATSTTPTTCATPGSRCTRRSRTPPRPSSSSSAPPAPGAGGRGRAGGPAVRSGRLVRHLGGAHRPGRRPGLPDPADQRPGRAGDGALDQGGAAAVRLPRQRAGRRAGRRGPDASGRAAQDRPPAGAPGRPRARPRHGRRGERAARRGAGRAGDRRPLGPLRPSLTAPAGDTLPAEGS